MSHVDPHGSRYEAFARLEEAKEQRARLLETCGRIDGNSKRILALASRPPASNPDAQPSPTHTVRAGPWTPI